MLYEMAFNKNNIVQLYSGVWKLNPYVKQDLFVDSTLHFSQRCIAK